jgi:hypothetical protein
MLAQRPLGSLHKLFRGAKIVRILPLGEFPKQGETFRSHCDTNHLSALPVTTAVGGQSVPAFDTPSSFCGFAKRARCSSSVVSQSGHETGSLGCRIREALPSETGSQFPGGSRKMLLRSSQPIPGELCAARGACASIGETGSI